MLPDGRDTSRFYVFPQQHAKGWRLRGIFHILFQQVGRGILGTYGNMQQVILSRLAYR